MSLRFHVADSLTGRLVGRLYPVAYEWEDPLRGSAGGTLTLALPQDPEAVERLRQLILPRIRQVVVEEDGQYVLSGPIPRRPNRASAGTVVVPVVDWRHWFYKAVLRPNGQGVTGRGDLVYDTDTEQGLLAATIMAAGQRTWAGVDSGAGLPEFVVDHPPGDHLVTGIQRQLTARSVSRSLGDFLDDLRDRNTTGLEWWTYSVEDPTDPQLVQMHVTTAWPERQTRATPIRLTYVAGQGGNVTSYTWPESSEGASRVWALGEGEPPDQVVAVDTHPDVAAGQDLVWEEVTGPHSGVVRRETAFRHAHTKVERDAGLAGSAALTLPQSVLPIGAIAPGDRARVRVADGWVDVDLPACRIVSRHVSGGRDVPALHTLTVDLADPVIPGVDLPGIAGTD